MHTKQSLHLLTKSSQEEMMLFTQNSIDLVLPRINSALVTVGEYFHHS